MVSLLMLAGATVLAVVGIAVLRGVFAYRRGKKALNGELGKEQQWMAEMIVDDDKQFISAMESISALEQREAIIVANSKSELREQVIERANQ